MLPIKPPLMHLEDNATLTQVAKMGENHGDSKQMTESMTEKIHQIPPRPSNQRHRAAVRLQKTYKSFRTRRRLADCAVLVEQRWWKLLDFAVLKSSSISFFDIERLETATARWSRARTKAAKVGKGLSKDEKARKLALLHWLEAIDPRHRYGHNLQFYYVRWLHCNSKQPFFYWLDVGEGREVSLDRCSRLKLQQQYIKYLGPIERRDYEVEVDNGTFMFKQSGKLIDTTAGPEDAKWIFVLSVSKILYIAMKKKGTFQHSSFLAGGATLSAGRLVVENGILKAVWPHSGHYLPTAENFDAFMSFLSEHNVDLSIVQRRSPGNKDEAPLITKESGVVLRNSKSEPDVSRMKEGNTKTSEWNQSNAGKDYCSDAEHLHPTLSRRGARAFSSKLTTLDIPKREHLFEILKKTEQQSGPKYVPLTMDSSSDDEDGYETPEELLLDVEFIYSKRNLFDEGEEEYEECVPKEKIIQRINSHKVMNSYQLAHQLSCKWTTGAGPRIGCMRDYPSELQLRVLEEVSLSPKGGAFSSHRRACSTSQAITSTSLCREKTSGGISTLALD